MPGSSSSSAAVAELRLTAAADRLPGRARHSPGTSTCIPSARGAARLIAAVSAGAVAPPARATASATRLPSASRYRPGRRTAPATWTVSAGRRCGRLGDERLGLLGGGARAAQRAPGHGQQRERGCREDERPPARHGQGGHVPSVPAKPSRRVNASATIVCQFAGLDDEVDELAGHDDRLPGLAAVQVRAHALGGARQRDRAPPPRSTSATWTRSRSFPFTCTTTSTVSRSSSAGSASGHGCSQSRSCPSRCPQLLGDVRCVRLDQRHGRLGREARVTAAGVAGELVDELHHGRDAGVEREAPADVVGHLRDRLVRLPCQRRRRPAHRPARSRRPR